MVTCQVIVLCYYICSLVHDYYAQVVFGKFKKCAVILYSCYMCRVFQGDNWRKLL